MGCPRSWLLTAADNQGRIRAAMTSGADAVILDLEDGVVPSRKPDARVIVQRLLHEQGAPSPELWVRINDLNTPWWRDDIACVLSSKLAGLVLPKATPEATNRLAAELSAMEHAAGLEEGKIGLLPLATETATATLTMSGYRPANRRLRGLTWGIGDLVLDLGALTGRAQDGSYTPVMEMVRSLVILAAASAEVPAIETAFMGTSDARGLREHIMKARRDGFIGMLAVDPAQVATIHEAFAPAPEEITAACKIVAAFESAGEDGVLDLDGKMLYAPHLSQARRLLAPARSA
ncbi:MAG: CoA ester lyase, partial [Rhizobium pusense]|nr:CoA ester lyase [Agrobacterium pusense]